MTSAAQPSSTRVDLDLAALFRRSWEMFAQKPLEHIAASAVILFLGLVTLGVLFGPLFVAYIRMIDRQRRGESIALGQIFDLSQAGAAFVASALIGLAVFLGFLLMVLPGLVALLAWCYAFWFIALEGQGALESMGSSWRLLKAHFGSVVVVCVLELVLHSLGGAALLGTLITFPFGTLFASAAFIELRK